MIGVHFIKRTVATLAGPFLRLDHRIAEARARYIICYHRVISAEQAEREWVHEAMWISPASFDAQIRWMCSVGEVVSLDLLLASDARNERPLFALTFDDGWRDNLIHALPILQRYGAHATVFLATSFMKDGRLIWPEDLMMKTALASAWFSRKTLIDAISELAPRPKSLPSRHPRAVLETAIEQLKQIGDEDRRERILRHFVRLGLESEPLKGQMLNWQEAGEMFRAGIGIGSHSHTHRICSEATPEQIEWEMKESRECILRNLGCEVSSFAYPNARYHGYEGEILSRTGYRHAFRIHNMPVKWPLDPYFVPRFIADEVTTGSPEYFKFRLLGLY